MIRYFASTQKGYVISKGPDFPIPKNNGNFTCVFLENPSEEETSRVCTELKFPKKHFLGYTKEGRSLRYSMRPLMFVFIDYYVEDNRIKRTNTLFAMKKNALVVTIPHKSKYYTELFNTLALRIKEEKRKKNPLSYFLYYFLYDDARGNYDVIDEMEDKVMEIEESVKKIDIKQKFIEDIVKLKRNCFKMSKHLWASAKLIFTIKKGLTPLTLDKELLILMDDVYDTFIHQIDLLAVQREILTDLLEIYATIINNRLAAISNNLNVVMKKLTALTVIIMIPTFMASFYGMNFKYMPELESPYGYIIVTVVMLIFATLSYLFFHKKEWI